MRSATGNTLHCWNKQNFTGDLASVNTSILLGNKVLSPANKSLLWAISRKKAGEKKKECYMHSQQYQPYPEDLQLTVTHNMSVIMYRGCAKGLQGALSYNCNWPTFLRHMERSVSEEQELTRHWSEMRSEWTLGIQTHTHKYSPPPPPPHTFRDVQTGKHHTDT